MKTIEEACDKIRCYLSKWYDSNKEKLKGTYSWGSALHEAKQNFIKENPEYKQFDFNINTGFDVDGKTWHPGCLDGCCTTGATVRGIYAEPIDWGYTRNLAFRVSKVLSQRRYRNYWLDKKRA